MKPVMAGLALCTLLAASIHAQTRPMKAEIPFPFHVGQTQLAAGQYELVKLSALTRAWAIRPPQATGVIFMGHDVTALRIPETSALVFHRYGNTYFLTQVRVQGNETGCKLAPSAWERELAKAASSVEMASIEARYQ